MGQNPRRKTMRQQERFRISFGGDMDSAEDANAYSE
jgi:hypothetical protein